MSSPPGGGVAPRAVAGTDRLGQGIEYHLREYRGLLQTKPGAPVARMIGDAGGRILDVGCGIGQMLFWLARRSRPDLLVGVDFDRNALGFGRNMSLSGSEPGRPVRFAAADAARLPFLDRSFDLVICRVVLMSVPVRPVLRELARLVAPGGRLYLHLTGPGYYVEELLRGRWKGSLFALLNGVLMHALGRQIRVARLWNNFQTVGRVVKILESEGLVPMEIDTSRRHLGLPVSRKLLAERRPPS
jgi:SAM-dependent methyltransferase